MSQWFQSVWKFPSFSNGQKGGLKRGHQRGLSEVELLNSVMPIQARFTYVNDQFFPSIFLSSHRYKKIE